MTEKLTLKQAASVFSVVIPDWLDDDVVIGKIASVSIRAGEVRRLTAALEEPFLKEARVMADVGLDEAEDYIKRDQDEAVKGLKIPGLHDKVVELLKSGSIISAIKEVRYLTGLGLREAKSYVDQIREEVDNA
jgi:ribosomal protein L7/L12